MYLVLSTLRSTYYTNPINTYTISMDNKTPTSCPVPNCPGSYNTRIGMRTHFQHRHWRDIIIIEEEGRLPQCIKCLLFTSTALSERHRNSKTCALGQTRRERRQQQLTNEIGESTTIYVNGTAIENVNSFRYLGRILTTDGNDNLAMAYNLQKAKKSWRRIQTILLHQGASPKTSSNFYKAVVQAILLYASETWNITDQQLTSLNGFHNKVTRHISDHRIRRIHPSSDVWLYPDIEKARKATNIKQLSTYINVRKTNLLNWAQNRQSYQIARHLETTLGTSHRIWGPSRMLNNTQDTNTTTTNNTIECTGSPDTNQIPIPHQTPSPNQNNTNQ
jgi:hypothetical protein